MSDAPPRAGAAPPPDAEADQEARAPDALARTAVALFAAGTAADEFILRSLGAGGESSLLSSAILGGPLALAAVWRALRTRRLRRLGAPLVCLAAYVAWALTSVLWARDADAHRAAAITLGQLLVVVLLGWQSVQGRRELRAALTGYLAGCTAVIAGAWAAYAAGRTFGVEALEEFEGAEAFEGALRFAATGFDPNDMGVTIAIGIPVAVYLALAGRGRLRRLLLLYLPAAGIGLALSGSRGAALTAAVALACVVGWMWFRGAVAAASALALAAAGIAVAAWAVPWETWGRILTVSEALQGSVGERTAIWRAGLDLLARHPLVGVGAGGFVSAIAATLPFHAAAHNTPLQVAVELGIVGLLLFLGAPALVLRSAARAPLDEKALAIGLVLTLLVGCSSLSWALRKTLWLVLLLGAAAGSLRPAPPDPQAP